MDVILAWEPYYTAVLGWEEAWLCAHSTVSDRCPVYSLRALTAAYERVRG